MTDQNETITKLENDLKALKNDLKWSNSMRDTTMKELEEAHTLMTALGVPARTEAEESYLQRDISIANRIALFIATKK